MLSECLNYANLLYLAFFLKKKQNVSCCQGNSFASYLCKMLNFVFVLFLVGAWRSVILNLLCSLPMLRFSVKFSNMVWIQNPKQKWNIDSIHFLHSSQVSSQFALSLCCHGDAGVGGGRMWGSQSPHEVDRSHDQGRGGMAAPHITYSEWFMRKNSSNVKCLLENRQGSSCSHTSFVAIFFAQIPPAAIEIATEEEVSTHVPFHINHFVSYFLCWAF